MTEQQQHSVEQYSQIQVEPRQVYEVAEASFTTAAQALELNSKNLVDQIFDSMAVLCADAFDELNCGLRNLQVYEGSKDGPQQSLTPELLSVLWQGMEQLSATHQARVDEQMEKFEAHVLQTCLHVPPGLVASAPVQCVQSGDESADEAQLAELNAELAKAREEIAAANQAVRRVQREIKMYDEVLKKYGDLSQLQSVAGALAGKENAAEDAMAMVSKGASLQAEWQGLKQLGRQRAESSRVPAKDAMTAEKELLQLHPGARGLTPQDFQALQSLLARQ